MLQGTVPFPLAPIWSRLLESELYDRTLYLSTQYDSDMVWADGFFIRYPAGVAMAQGAAAAP